MASLINSAILAGGAVAIALPLGTLLAVLLTRFNLPGRRIAIACLGVLLFLPLYVQLSGWDAALGKLGWFTLAHGSLAQPFLAGMRGATFVHGMAAVPWVALLVGIGLLQVDPAQEEAALLVAPAGVVLWRITLRQSTPFVVAAIIWTIVSTTSDMTVTNIYLINPREWTYTERFYMRMASGDATKAAIAVLPGIAAMGALVLLSLAMIARLVLRRSLTKAARQRNFSAGRSRLIATAAVWGAVIMLLGVPVASLISKAGFVVVHEGATRWRSWSLAKCVTEVAAAAWSFDWEHGLRLRPEFSATLLVSSTAATLSLIVSSTIAWRARRRGRWASLAVVLTALFVVIPGPVVGAALIRLFNHDMPPLVPWGPGAAKSWLLVLYDNTPLAPIIAQAIRALPLTLMLLWHSFATLNDDVLDAAALDGLSPARVFWKIALPQRWRAILATIIAAFAIAAGDLGWSHLVTPPGLDLLSRRVFGLVHSGVEEQVAAISLNVMIAYAALAVIVMGLVSAKNARNKL